MSGNSFELAIEIGKVVKPDFVTDFKNRGVFFREVIARFVDAYFVQKFSICFSGTQFKEPAKSTGRHISHRSHLLQLDRSMKLAQSKLDYIIESYAIDFLNVYIHNVITQDAIIDGFVE